MTGAGVNGTALALLREAAAWRLIGLLLEYPGEGWREEVRSLADQVADPELAEAAAAGLAGGSPGAYLAALGPGGAVSPREVAYCGFQEPGRLLADLAAFYAAFDYRPAVPECPDHVAVEAGFVGYLRLKEAYARRGGSPAKGEVAAEAAREFIAEHLAPVAAPLAERLEGAGAGGLALAARALLRRVGPPRQRQAPPLPCAAGANCPSGCDEPEP